MPDTGIRHTAESDKTQTPDFSSRRIGIAPDRRGIMEVKDILEAQRRFFAAGNTLDPAIRKQYLKALQTEIRKREKEICGALHEASPEPRKRESFWTNWPPSSGT